MIQVTLNFPDYAAVQEAFSKLAGTPAAAAAVIGHTDRPDVGVSRMLPAIVAAVEPNPFAAAAEPAVVPVPPAPPVAASPASAPAVIAAVPPAGGAAELDSQGLPWDGRIHGSTKSKNADGSWRQKRGLNDEALKLRIEAELRAAQGARAPAVPTPPPAPPVAAPVETFGTLMARIAPRMSDAAFVTKMNETFAAFGLTSLASLANRGDLVVPFAAMLEAA